jgi:hypothetical protein
MSIARTIAVAGALLGWIAADTGQGQELLLNQVVQGNWLRCSVVGGRITVDGTRSGNTRSTSKRTGHDEAINIRNENGQFALDYERSNREERLIIEIASTGNRVVIRRTPQGNSATIPVEFSQVSNDTVTLTFGSGTQQQVFRAQGVWQLLIAQPKECRQHLLPLLEMLRPNWNLADTAVSIEKKLLRDADGNASASRVRWATLVDQLADERFAKRETADRALRRGDSSALAYLRQLDFARLDAEQQFRVQHIIEALAGQNDDDSAEQAASMLACNPMVLLALLGRPELTTRQTAARQLISLLGGPIPVDVAADPDAQKAQRERLRARIEGK